MTEWVLILRVLRRRWWMPLLPVIVAAALLAPGLLRGESSSGGFTTRFKYSAAQELNLPQRDGDYQDVWLASELAVNAFTEWVRSSTFRDEIAAYLDDESINLGLLGIGSDNARSVGQVDLSYPDAEALERIAAAAIIVLETRTQAYFPHLGDSPARVTILDAPRVVASPPPLTNRFAPLFTLGVALLGGLVLTFFYEMLFDRTLRYPDELEACRLPVLALVPPEGRRK